MKNAYLFVQSALPGIPLFKTLVQKMKYLEITDKPPLCLPDESRRHLAGNPLDIQVRPETLQYIYDKINIIRQFQPQEVPGIIGEFLFHASALHYLKLMKLH